ncbi:type ISP restriction/modification enzyme [Bacillus cereus]
MKNNFVNEENIVIDETKIQWSRELKRKLKNDICIEFDESKVVEALYRPFTKKHIYYDKNLISYPGKFSNQQKNR